MHGLCLLVGIGADDALLLIAVRALTVAAADADATEAVVESLELGKARAKREG